MKLLLDEHFSHRLRRYFSGHDVFTVSYMGWRGTQNGALLAKAAAAGFDAVITMDAGIQYQQNLAALPCSVIVIQAESNAVEHVQPLIRAILQVLSDLRPQTIVRVGN
ncbi:MAG TPA: DUF5615 family PIN-like protein [Phycisphaerae bacterium]|nr:DUF5615 family PIN-like protein [Phycisphaerae bacterium]